MLVLPPLVSIGIPTYNGERFIQQTLESLLAQTYQPIEIIISDNASTDRTAEICRAYCERYPHMRLVRNAENIGASRNFSQTFRLSSGRYFMWASDHDLWEPTFIAQCVAILEHDPTVVLSYAYTQLIDHQGHPQQIMTDRIDTRGKTALERYRYVLWNLHACNMIFGVFRSSALGTTGLYRNTYSPDTIVLAEISLQGAIAQIPEVLFYRRENRPHERPEQVQARRLRDVFPTKEITETDAQLRLGLRNDHLAMVRQAPLPTLKRWQAEAITWLCFMVRYRAGWLSLRFLNRLWQQWLPPAWRIQLSKVVNKTLGG